VSQQTYRDLLAAPPLANLANISPSNTEVALIPVSAGSKLAIAAMTLKPAQVLKVTAGGVVTTGATAINWTITPRWGTTNAGTTLGASQAVAKTASLTAVPWLLQFWLQVRTVNDTAATQTTVVGVGSFESAGTARDIVIGGTAATIDTASAAGLWFGIVASGADVSATFTPQIVIPETIG
jgi:hypothetical protein